MTQNLGRTFNIPKEHTNSPDNAIAYNQTYVGFVKSNTDAISMGRLVVWIPELSTNPVTGLFTVNYCSPFAGATPIDAVRKDDKNNAQESYGFWAVPPDVENEVVVQFINGDPNRGIWIGCLYQQYMNNMVPGIPNQRNTTSNGKESSPTLEYNKKDQTEAPKDTPLRPPYRPLTSGLLNEGLIEDSVRGTSSSSARRNTKSNVLGLLSPGGSQFVMDDDPDNKFIRLRTAGGTQILINDSIGMIYMISKNGNSWLEISDDGIDAYSSGSISMRGQGDLNLHADGSVNIFGSKGVKIATPAGLSLQATGAFDVVSGGVLNLTSKDTLSVKSTEDIALSSSCTIGIKAVCNVALQANGCIGLTSTCGLYLKGAPLFSNGPTGPLPSEATEASITATTNHTDRELNVNKGYPELSTKTIVSRLPSHEPWRGHSTSSSDASVKPVNLNNSVRVQAGDGVTQPNPSDILPGKVDVPVGDNTNWWIPASGLINSLFGFRPGNVAGNGNKHPGIDISGNNGVGIIAAKSGKVIFAALGVRGGGYGGYGNCVVIDHGGGLSSLYAHMNNVPCVNKGDTVIQGQLLGNVGATGDVTGPHLHFEIRQGGSPVDPASYIPNLGKKGIRISAGNPNPNNNATPTTSVAANVST